MLRTKGLTLLNNVLKKVRISEKRLPPRCLRGNEYSIRIMHDKN